MTDPDQEKQERLLLLLNELSETEARALLASLAVCIRQGGGGEPHSAQRRAHMLIRSALVRCAARLEESDD